MGTVSGYSLVTESLTPFELKVHELTKRLLDEHRSSLSELELRADFRGVRILDEGLASRASELEVVFLRGRDIADVFEFFVMKDGVPHVTIDEVEGWLRSELAGLSERHG